MLSCAVGSMQMLKDAVMHGMMANGVTRCSGTGCSIKKVSKYWAL